jgi:hypothetical protein
VSTKLAAAVNDLITQEAIPDGLERGCLVEISSAAHRVRLFIVFPCLDVLAITSFGFQPGLNVLPHLAEVYGWFVVMSTRVDSVVNGWRGRRGNQTETRQAQASEYELDAQGDRSVGFAMHVEFGC